MNIFLKAFLSLSIIILIFFVFLLSVQTLAVDIKLPSFLPFQNVNHHTLKTIKSNQWYSSLYSSLPSQPLYAFPIAFRLTERGLGFSYPDIVRQPQTIFASYDEDFTVGTNSTFSRQVFDWVSDWSIGSSLKTADNDQLRFTLGHGIPFTTLTSSKKPLVITPSHPLQIYPDNRQLATPNTTTTNALRLTVRNHHYIIVFPKGSSVHYTGNRLESDSKTVFVGLLDKPENYNTFLSISDAEIKATQVSFAIENQSLVTSYKIITNGKTPLIALFPHQFDFLTGQNKSLGTYATLRGDMNLLQTNIFTTSLPLQTPPTTFHRPSSLSPTLTEQIKRDTNLLLNQPPPTSKDYYLGIYFGEIATLIQLADTAGLTQEKKRLTEYLKPLYINSMEYFSYDKTKTSLIAQKSEFGNDTLNDHHFHYGYFIRTAAILAKDDPVFLKTVTPKVTEMVNDIATLERTNKKYPFLRNFDIYEGHSWADGFANFADGNNQESSSEALHAWYALSLWADVRKNKTLQDYALYLFNTELISTRYYWFDEKEIYKLPYEHKIASIVWGGKLDFTTWFSDKPNMIYGIQLLPFTPASSYLKTISDYPRYEKDLLDHGGDLTADWGELMMMWKSFSQPTPQGQAPSSYASFYEGTLPSLYLYQLSNNSNIN